MPQALVQLQEDLVFTPSNNDPYTVTLSMVVDGMFIEDTSSITFADASLYYWGDGISPDSVFIELQPTGLLNHVLQADLLELRIFPNSLFDSV